MKVYDKLPRVSDGKKRVVALGLFDGVHIGHRYLIKEARRLADDAGLPLAVFTFYSEDALPKGKERLYTTEEKLSLLCGLSVDEVFIARFSELAETEPGDFVSSVLINSIGAELAVCGEDFRFGRCAAGDAAMLSSFMSMEGRCGVTVSDMKRCGKKVSTIDIKALLSEGRVSEAGELLAEPYFITARVLHGDGRGKGLGLPTVNTECVGYSENLPRGVYKSQTVIDGNFYKSITNIGICPTFSERRIHTETFILDYFGELYGENVTIRFLDFIRAEERFSSAEELVSQINSDIERAWGNNGRKLD
ncbi:MAG: riboflavin biosynthesis protein RibF [Clostridia bacterium]|nr:riboflavin biosynthesis protein RibF [Clostridia bacterium]